MFILKLSIIQVSTKRVNLFLPEGWIVILKIIAIAAALILSQQVNASTHVMQHGFILHGNDTLGSHLVASGHHSRHVEIIGKLVIRDVSELALYQQRKENSSINESYFLLQAQQLDLHSLTAGQVLTGHIIESKIGSYEPKNIIVKSANFYIRKVLLNIPNPFFSEGSKSIYSDRPNLLLRQNNKHCCETGSKPCNWKC